MKRTVLLIVVLLSLLNFIPYGQNKEEPQINILSNRQMSLERRYSNKYVNDVFKDNILLTLAYASGKVKKANDINWDEVRKPFRFELTLNSQEVFAFHNDVFSEFKDKLVFTTNAHFNYEEGFKSDGYLMGDGVCHLASLINWAAKAAQLEVSAPTNHDFAVIPEVPREYGTSIYSNPGQTAANAVQNLYVKNNRSRPVTLRFDYDGDILSVLVVESIPTLSKN